MNVKNLVLYDYMQVAGGAERLAMELTEGLPDTELIISRIFPQAHTLTKNFRGAIKPLGNRATRPLGRIIESFYCFSQLMRFSTELNAVFYSGNYAPLAVHQQLSGKKIYYCNTPPRFAYDWSDSYRQRIPKPLRWFYDCFVAAYRRRYEHALSQMDTIVTNSENVRRRIKKYLNLEVDVIYPPVDIARFRWLSQGDYFVSTARLMPYKRIDLIVQAFLAMPAQRLVVLSGGAEQSRLQQLAQGAANITFAGWQSDDQVRGWVGNARAAIYIPKDEDFGISPVEAMAAGKPVIGVADGGLLETITHAETGVLLPASPSVQDLIEAVQFLSASAARNMRPACEARAQAFSREIFLNKMRALLV